MRTRAMTVALALLAGSICGCGYTTRALHRTDVRTVAVPIFESRSFRRGIEYELTRELINLIELRYPDGQIKRPTSKDLVTDVPAGTEYLQHAGGGGGYGPAIERPAAKVQEEVRNGIISLAAARDAYGVALDPDTLELLEDQTALLRSQKG